MTEWQQRQLCPDGACIGVIGPDGTCKVCGRVAPNWGDERKRGLLEEPADEENAALPADDDDDDDEDYEDGDDADDGSDEDEDEDDDAEPASAAGSEEWEERKLCPDEACIGVIGDDGACKVCGKRAA